MHPAKESKFERFLNKWTLLFLNILIVIFMETTGMFAMHYGLVHLIAFLFIGLGIVRIFVHYEVYDRFLKPLIYGGIAILILFAISHVVEFASYTLFHLSFESIAVNVVNFYLIGLLIIAYCVTYFFKGLGKGLIVYRYILPFGMIIIILSMVIFNLNPHLVNLEPTSWLMYTYLFAVIGVTALVVSWLVRLKNNVSILVKFVNYFNVALVLIAISALIYVLNEPLEAVGIEYMQTMYLSHFLFYGALSLLFLSFVKLSHMGGMYNELQDRHGTSG